ncbi:kinase-like domain-containing protein [Mycena belliarum]|uniref:Kinase-like domain-containing protein n=1 Tax=Mycena belliarum TaxID=1033014 RepID=A0AAD6U7Q4_9AGAR|nr:kinase-like domain-containing protein [Mycena belliae]
MPKEDGMASMERTSLERATARMLGLDPAEIQFPPGWEPGLLTPRECFWRDHHDWLEGCGYKLRPRYHPDWVPSWTGTNKDFSEMPDGAMKTGPTLDAVRMRDQADVMLKLLRKSTHVREVNGEVEGKFVELEIGLFFSSEPLVKDPRNHCVPILEVLEVPDDDDCIMIVMPLLRKFALPRFDTFGEAIDFFKQIFEGLKFMHDHNVAHRDCNGRNLMMDASSMYPSGFHPMEPKKKRDFLGRAKFYNRTRRPPKYYLIDFGISRQYSTRSPPPLEPPIAGGDKSVPEFRDPKPCDPFPTDIYFLGNMIRRNFTEGSPFTRKLLGFEFMSPLVDMMVAEDPSQRPTIDEVIARFAAIRDGLSSWKLRSRVIKEDDLVPGRGLKHWLRRIRYILLRTPAIPRYRSKSGAIGVQIN